MRGRPAPYAAAHRTTHMKLPRLPAEMPDLPVRSFARIAATDLLRGRGRVRSARAHLDAAVA